MRATLTAHGSDSPCTFSGSSRWLGSPTWLRLAAYSCHLPFPMSFTSFPDILHATTRLTSAAFQRGYSPICPVMCSRCLSAGSLRFLRHLVPTGEFSLPCGWLTAFRQTPLGLPRSTRVRYHRGGLLLYRGERVSTKSIHQPDFPMLPTSPFQPVTVTGCHAASSEVHLRSPVRCSPSPVASFGSTLP